MYFELLFNLKSPFFCFDNTKRISNILDLLLALVGTGRTDTSKVKTSCNSLNTQSFNFMFDEMKTVEIPEKEYKELKEELKLLKDSDLLRKVNRLIDLLFQEKYGLSVGDYTGDLAEFIVKDSCRKDSAWDRS